MLSSGIDPTVLAKLDLWQPHDKLTWPDWYRFDGRWYEEDGENTRYCTWDNLGDNAIVFDIGAYEGAWTKRMAEKYETYQFHSFEPAPRAYGVACKRLVEFDNVSLYNFALGTTTKKALLYDSQNDGATLIQDDGASVGVQIMDFREFVEREGIKKIHLASVNVEGWEFELLPYLISTGLIRQIERLMIQWHSVVSNSREQQFAIQDAIALTHEMTWNLGAWEAWSLRSPK